jgi:transposase
MRTRGPRRFTDDFRREAVRLVKESERPLKDIAAELGLSPTGLRNWVRRLGREKPATTGPARVVLLEEQVRQLTRENDRLREEREILKKATAFFAKERR